MKTIRIISFFILCITCVLFTAMPFQSFSQNQKTKGTKQSIIQNKVQELKKEQKASVLDQNISIYAENESLSTVIERICNYLHLDYSYNSNLIEGKNISLNMSNKPIKDVLSQLMKDSRLLFEIQDNLLVVRDHDKIDKSIDYEKKMRNYTNQSGFVFDNPKKKSITINFKSSNNLIIIPVAINNSDTLNFILDTGVRYPIITELPFVNKLNLNYLQPISVKGLGEGEQLTAYRSGNNIININGMVAYDQDIHMVINENFQISHILGMPVQGDFVFRIVDFDYIIFKKVKANQSMDRDSQNLRDLEVLVDHHMYLLIICNHSIYFNHIIARPISSMLFAVPQSIDMDRLQIIKAQFVNKGKFSNNWIVDSCIKNEIQGV